LVEERKINLKFDWNYVCERVAIYSLSLLEVNFFSQFILEGKFVDTLFSTLGVTNVTLLICFSEKIYLRKPLLTIKFIFFTSRITSDLKTLMKFTVIGHEYYVCSTARRPTQLIPWIISASVKWLQLKTDH
jgi:hypothetical protein